MNWTPQIVKDVQKHALSLYGEGVEEEGEEA